MFCYHFVITELKWPEGKHVEESYMYIYIYIYRCFLGRSSGKEPTCQCRRWTQVQSQGWEDSLDEGMATHSNIHAWKIPWTEELGGLHSKGSQRVIHDWSDLPHTCARTHTHTHIHIYICMHVCIHTQLKFQWTLIYNASGTAKWFRYTSISL